MYNIITTKFIELVDRYIPKQARNESGKLAPKWLMREIKQILKKNVSFPETDVIKYIPQLKLILQT